MKGSTKGYLLKCIVGYQVFDKECIRRSGQLISIKVAHYDFGSVVMHGVHKVSDEVVVLSYCKGGMRIGR